MSYPLRRLLTTIWLVALLVSGCTTIVLTPAPRVPSPIDTPTLTATPAATPAATSTPTVTPTPSSTLTPTPEAVLGTLSVYYLDIGQGDSTLLMGPDFTFLIDAGRHDRSDVVPYLEQYGVESIDLLIGTHPHADHIGQIDKVLQRFPVEEVWLSGDTSISLTFERMMDAIEASDAGYHEPRAGEVYEIGSARVEVINPSHLAGLFNDGSVSVRIMYGGVAFLFTGDAEAQTEAEMMAHGHDLRAQVLKLGHHGSRTSSSAQFLQAVQPNVAIWSAGKDNSYGHPHDEVIDRLAQMGIATYGTAEYGTIVVTTDGQRYEVLVNGARAPTPTPIPEPTATFTPIPPSGCAPGQVNINIASHQELQCIIHVGPDRAGQILQLRPFSSVDDMVRISGITAARLADIKAQGVACVD